jgi:hypothetical protein
VVTYERAILLLTRYFPADPLFLCRPKVLVYDRILRSAWMTGLGVKCGGIRHGDIKYGDIKYGESYE